MFKKTLVVCVCLSILTTVAFAENVYVTSNGKKYHLEDCPLIANKNAKAIPIQEAEVKNLTACSKCIGKLQAKAGQNEQLVKSEDAVYKTKSGKKYHKQNCPLIKNKETSASSLKDAQTKGLKPCGKCFKEELAKVE